MFVYYSVIIISIPKEINKNGTECVESSAFYNVQNTSSFSLLVPQNKLLNNIPEIQIHPNCTYKIQVYANPRTKLAGKLPEVRLNKKENIVYIFSKYIT